MRIYKCGIPSCEEYIPEDELKKVKLFNNIINICMICDDGSYETVNGGEHFDTIKKSEKIRKRKKKQDQ